MYLLLFGFVLLIFGIYLKKFPPDYYTQKFIGYRTPRSMKDENSWNKANKLAAKMLIAFGFCNLMVGLILLRVNLFSESTLQFVCTCLTVITIFLLFFLVEKKL